MCSAITNAHATLAKSSPTLPTLASSLLSSSWTTSSSLVSTVSFSTFSDSTLCRHHHHHHLPGSIHEQQQFAKISFLYATNNIGAYPTVDRRLYATIRKLAAFFVIIIPILLIIVVVRPVSLVSVLVFVVDVVRCSCTEHSCCIRGEMFY